MRVIGNLLKYISGLLIVAGLLMLMGCGSVDTAAQSVQTTQTKQQSTQSPQLAPYNWKAIPVPAADQEFLGYTVSPLDPTTIYACTSNGSSPSQNPITLWRTKDAGQHWSALHLPSSPGTDCQISIATTQPQRLAVLITNSPEIARPCDNDVLYISNDGGNSWQHVPYTSIAPTGAHAVFCQVTATAHYLYLCYSFNEGQNSPQLSMLERSGDNGATWTRIDSAFGAKALFSPPQVGPNDTLALIVRHLSQNDQPALWITHDAGNTWQQMGTLPNAVGTFLLAPPATNTSWPSAATPFYALAAEQIPSNLYRLRVFQSADGQQWTALPPLPVSGVSAQQPGLLQALTVTADGRLLAFGVSPQSGLSASDVNAPKTSSFWLWLWNPSSSHWQVLPTPLNHPADENCGLCWDGQVSTSSSAASSDYLYVYHWNDPNSFFRVRLPSI